MDFGDPYYKKLMTLVQSNEKNATADLWKVVDEVAAFYQQNGFTEYWVSPAEDDMNTFQGTAWKQEKPFPLKKRPDESASNVAQRAVESGSQEKNATTIDSESSSSADLSKRKRPSKLSVAGFQGKKSLGSDVLPPTGRIGQEGIACVVCKKLGFTNGNSVIECQECHDMYHQKCHTPNISQNQVDPRSVWYCTKCSKLMRKIAAKAQATTPPSVSVPEKLSAMGKNPPSLKSSAADNPLGKMFSRFEATGAFGYSTATASSTPKPLHAISDLAANFFAKYQAKSKNQAKLCASSMKASVANDQHSNFSSTSAGNNSPAERSSSKSFVSSANNSSKPSLTVASSQLQAAEKRLLQMKKKAAMKTTYKSLP